MKGVFFLAYIRGGATLEEKEISNIYAIPANYTDSGKLLGGMVEPRNAVETGFLLSFWWERRSCCGFPCPAPSGWWS